MVELGSLRCAGYGVEMLLLLITLVMSIFRRVCIFDQTRPGVRVNAS